MSLVWKFFTRVPEDSSKAKWNICGLVRSLGSTDRAKQTTTNCAAHLESSHGTAWKEVMFWVNHPKRDIILSLSQKKE